MERELGLSGGDKYTEEGARETSVSDSDPYEIKAS